jgi:hypothetical protein
MGSEPIAQERRYPMITLVKKMFSKLLYDDMAVRRWARSALFFVGGGGIAFADQLSQLISSPEYVQRIKVLGVVCAALGGAVTAGQRNKPIDQPPVV